MSNPNIIPLEWEPRDTPYPITPIDHESTYVPSDLVDFAQKAPTKHVVAGRALVVTDSEWLAYPGQDTKAFVQYLSQEGVAEAPEVHGIIDKLTTIRALREYMSAKVGHWPLGSNANPVRVYYDSEWAPRQVDGKTINITLAQQFAYTIEGRCNMMVVHYSAQSGGAMSIDYALMLLAERMAKQGIKAPTVKAGTKYRTRQGREKTGNERLDYAIRVNGALTIQLVAHWGAGDMRAFGVPRKATNGMQGVEAISKGYATLPGKSIKLACWDKLRNKQYLIRYTVGDSINHAPDKASSLEALGKAVGIEKLTVNQRNISQMDNFRREDPEAYWHYAVRDPLVAMAYIDAIYGVNG